MVRIIAQIKKTLKSRFIAAQTLSTYDEHFKTIMASLPEDFQIHSQSYLDPRLLTAVCSLQSMRFFLYRHNLTAACRRAERRDALDRCLSVAKDTAHYISRTISPPQNAGVSGYYSPAHMANWAARLRTQAPTAFCTHLWRCTLVAIFRFDFAVALTLVQASAAAGDMRRVNGSCGRYLSFFLEKLMGRLRNGANQDSLEIDEEMMVYVSGDLQASADEAWAWAGPETGVAQGSEGAAVINGHSSEHATSSQLHHALRDHPGNDLTEQEMQEWGGWEHVQRTIQQLLQEHQQAQESRLNAAAAAAAPPPPPQPGHISHQHSPYSQPSPTYPVPPLHRQESSSGAGQTLAPLQPAGSHGSSVSPAPNSNGGRISIKDIM